MTGGRSKVGSIPDGACVERAEYLQREADLCMAQGRYPDAEKLYSEANGVLRSFYGPSHRRYAESMNSLAVAYVAMGRHRAAAKLYQDIADISRAAGGDEDPLCLMSLRNLAMVYRAMGSFTQAEIVYRQVLDMHASSRDKNPATIASILTDLAWIYAVTARECEALTAIADAEHAHDQMIGSIVSRGSERDQIALIGSIRTGYYHFLSLILQYLPDSTDASGLLLDIVLRRKALGIEISLTRRVGSLPEQKASIQTRMDELRALRQQIVRKTVRGLCADEAVTTRNRDLQNRWTERRELEAALAREVSEASPFAKTIGAISRQAVASALPPKSALVELVKFRRYAYSPLQSSTRSMWQESRYAALVLLDGLPEAVRLLDLGEASTIDRLIAQFRASIVRGTRLHQRGLVSADESLNDPPDSPGIALRTVVFDPLKCVIGNRSRITLAPDGDLSVIPFEALPLDRPGRYLADDYHLSYVDCGRELLRDPAARKHPASLPVVVADPDFDLAVEDHRVRRVSLFRTLFHRRSSREFPIVSKPEKASRPLHELTPRHQEWHFERLPGTRFEGEIIAEKLGVPLWHGSAALEKRLKDCLSPRLLHLATHGFFLKNPLWDPDPDLTESTPAQHFLPTQSPLLRSGLALAGANHVFTPEVLPDAAEDGLLTAEDVAALDLRGTELVVLSACETGLGEIAVGEGVIGLRRAFLLAGAQTLIMSLWKVDDVATAIFMSRLYEYLIDAHMARDKALQRAQYDMRYITVGDLRSGCLNTDVVKRLAENNAAFRDAIEHHLARPDSYQPFEHPYYWSAFVLLGVTTPLEHPQAYQK